MGVAVVLVALAAVLLLGGAVPAVRARVPRGARVLAPLLLVLAAAVFALEATGVTDGPVDAAVLDAVVPRRSPGATALALGLSLGGGTTVTGGLGVVAGLVLWWRGRPRWALVWVAGVVVGSLVIRFVKLAVERPRPPVATRLEVETTASLPSGHALMAALGLGLVATATAALVRSRPVRIAVGALAVVLAAAIGASRVYLGVHWSTDVLAGWLLGAALVALAHGLAVLGDPRHRTVHTASPACTERGNDAPNG